MDLIRNFAYLRQVGIGAASGLLVFLIFIAAVGLTTAKTPDTSRGEIILPSNDASIPATPSASPSPTDLRTCSVAEYASNANLGNLQATVVNLESGEVLFDRSANTAGPTASVLKLFTAAAALEVLGPNYKVTTRVYADPDDPTVIYLVGAGDPTLSRTAPGKQTVYRDAPKLSSLALAVNDWTAEIPISRIVLDSTLFSGPSWHSSWERKGIREGYMSEVTALQVDGDRNNPGANTSARSNDPVLRAGEAFQEALGDSAIDAVLEEGELPDGAIEIANVSSAPISRWIKHMLLVSDNTEAEYLARLVSLELGSEGSFKSLNQSFKTALADTGLDLSSMTIVDGSGLSDGNKVSPKLVADLLKLVSEGYGKFKVIRDGMPVAGESGSLAGRYKGDLVDAAGKLAAKTGWIKANFTQAGLISAKDGAQLAFVIYAQTGSVSKTSADQAIDTLATNFYRCGDFLSNQ